MAEQRSPTKSKTRTYIWQGRDRQGRTQKGEMESTTAAGVTAALRQRGIIPGRIRKKPQSLFQRNSKIKTQDIVVTTRQLATMVDAGLPLVEAFKLLARGTKKESLRKVLEQVATDLEGGQALQEALSQHPQIFNELYVNMVRAGEKGGILDTVLDRLAVHLEKTEALRGKVKSALFYPVAVIVVAALVTAVLLTFVIPQFQDIFATFEGGLPGPTVMVINLSEGFRSNWYWILGGLFAAIYAFRLAYRRSERFHYRVDQALLHLPVLGEIVLKGATARMSRTFATLSAAGVPLLEILDTVGRTAGNRVIEKALGESREAVQQGERLTEPLDASEVFPPMVTQMIAIGEETGNLETMLAKIADFYESEVDAAVDGLTDLLEPAIMVVLGVVLGGLIIAMYLPIFQMGQAISG